MTYRTEYVTHRYPELGFLIVTATTLATNNAFLRTAIFTRSRLGVEVASAKADEADREEEGERRVERAAHKGKAIIKGRFVWFLFLFCK